MLQWDEHIDFTISAWLFSACASALLVAIFLLCLIFSPRQPHNYKIQQPLHLQSGMVASLR